MNQSVAPKINIGGTGISQVTLSETMDLFDQWIQQGEKKRVCVTPVNCVVWANKNAPLQQLYNSADLTLCVGVPLIWAAKLLKQGTLTRVTGLDLLPQYIQRCHQKGHTQFFLGAKEGVAALLQQQSEDRYPGIQIKGVYSPPFAATFSEEENEKMIAMINAVKPDILWVSLTAPKQDYWIQEHLHRLDVHIAIGVGGAFEVAAGLIDRAPVWMQKNGLEWFYRLYKEPRRLFKRYLVEAPAFIPIVMKQWWKGLGARC
ncbi:MAG: WecB/TagA/CpsF family glycosyltransferase [Chitinophagaceae bacterium]|nr:WecB/TagA/CpsF family glycosyltransferase [Chitinophagaceae bacterium]